MPTGVRIKPLPLSGVKTRLPKLITGVQEREEEVIVTKNGRPAAGLVNYDEYERLKETLEVLSDQDLMRQIQVSRTFYRRGKQGLAFEDVFGDVFGEPLLIPKRRRRA